MGATEIAPMIKIAGDSRYFLTISHAQSLVLKCYILGLERNGHMPFVADFREQYDIQFPEACNA